MNTNLTQFLKDKAKLAPKWANWLASLHPNTWYYTEFDTRQDDSQARRYRIAGLCESKAGLWFKLEDLK
jgi:hypothetical protein